MSEPIFPSAPGTSAAPSAAEPLPETRSNRKALLAVGGVVAAVAVGAGAFFMLNQAPADDVAAPTPRKPAASAPAEPEPSASPTKKATVKVVTVTAHDPFVALFPEDAKPADGSTSGDGTTPTTDGTTGGAGDTPTTAPTAPPDQSTSTSYKVAVTIIKPDTGAAQITVNGKPYAVSVGKSFAQFFTLYAIFNSDCVGVLFGDQNVPVCKSGPSTVTA